MPMMGKGTKANGQRVARALLLVQILPTLLIAPSHAGAVLLHSHCDESHHVHVLQGMKFAKWVSNNASEHHCATGEPDTCCETSESPHGADGMVLQCSPLLVCRVRSLDTAALQPILDTSLPQVAAACVTALTEPPDALSEVRPLKRCLDKLLSSSHALLI